MRGSNRVGVTVSRCERILLLAQGHLSTSISSSPYRLFVETSIHAHQSGGKGGKMGDMQLLVCIKGFWRFVLVARYFLPNGSYIPDQLLDDSLQCSNSLSFCYPRWGTIFLEIWIRWNIISRITVGKIWNSSDQTLIISHIVTQSYTIILWCLFDHHFDWSRPIRGARKKSLMCAEWAVWKELKGRFSSIPRLDRIARRLLID